MSNNENFDHNIPNFVDKIKINVHMLFFNGTKYIFAFNFPCMIQLQKLIVTFIYKQFYKA